MKKEKIKERDLWAEVLRNPFEYVHSIRYVIVSVACIAAIIIIHVACTYKG